MKLTSVKKALNEKLKELYPDIKIYGKEVQQGYNPPCFFTSLISQPETHSNKNFVSGGVTLKILYFQDIKNEADQLSKIDEIYGIFDKTIQIGNRIIEVKEKEFEYVGEASDILEISLKLQYLENRYQKPTEKAADAYDLKIKIKEEMEDERTGN